jgi:hypothetical protein
VIAALVAAVTIGSPIFAQDVPFPIRGTASPGQTVHVSIDPHEPIVAVANEEGRWEVLWSTPLATGTYEVRAGSASAILRMQMRGRLPRQPEVIATPPLPRAQFVDTGENIEMVNRWRITPPPYELNVESKGPLDPYNRNILKGDEPLSAALDDVFFVFTGISESLAEGRDDDAMFVQNIILSGDLYQGLTTFRPVEQRVKVTVAANARISDASRGRLSVQELFYERKLRDLSVNYDFLSFRAGVQPFVSDFRGFIYADSNPGFRLFGNLASNRLQYNVAIFDRLAKQEGTGLNRFERLRNQRVAIANLYWQDFLRPGFTQQFSIHHLTDEDLRATYLGGSGFGHAGRINVENALYYVFGNDRGDAVGSWMAAAEVSVHRDWLRPRIGFLVASDGFDSIFDSAAFAGGGFNFFARFDAASLKERGTIFPSMRSVDGRPNYDNPGLEMVTAGVDLDVTPRLKMIVTASELFDIGTDVSAGARYRPFLNNHVIISGGVAALIDYENETLYNVFTNVVLQF